MSKAAEAARDNRAGAQMHVRANSWNEAARTIEVIAATETPVPRWDVDGEYLEILRCAPETVDLARFIGAAVCLGHETWDPRDSIGVVRAAWCEAAQLIATVELTDRAEMAGVVADIVADRIRHVSVGHEPVMPEHWDVSRNPEGQRVKAATRWTPVEVSFVSVPADPAARVRGKNTMTEMRKEARADAGADGAAAAAPDMVSMLTSLKEMAASIGATAEEVLTALSARQSPDEFRAAILAKRAQAKPDAETVLRAARAADLEVRKLVRKHGLGDEFADTLIARGLSPDTASAAILTELHARQGGAVQGLGAARQTGESGDDPSVVRARMADAVAAKGTAHLRDGVRLEMPASARAYADLSMLEMGVELLKMRGERVGVLRTPSERFETLQRALSASDFPFLLANAGNKILLAEYQGAPVTYRSVFGRKSFRDFKPHSFLRSGDFPAPLEKGESADYKIGTMAESRNQITLGEFGRVVNISRRVLINDDLGAFAEIPQKAARRVAAWENATAWAVLAQASNAGPTVFDPRINSGNGRPLFHADHGNLAGSGTAIDVANIGIARAAMMKQVSLDGIALNVTPAFLVTGADRLTAAEQLLTTITPAQTSNAVPGFVQRLTPLGDANIAGNQWYLFASPADFETLVYGYLEGTEGPRFETRTRFENDGLDFKVAIDFQVGAIDYRGAYRNPGA